MISRLVYLNINQGIRNEITLACSSYYIFLRRC